MSFKSIAADSMTQRIFDVLGKGPELTRNELKSPISETTFRMLDDKLVTSGTVSAKELSAALQTTTDDAAEKMNRSLVKSEATPWYKKLFSSKHKNDLLTQLEAIFKVKPQA